MSDDPVQVTVDVAKPMETISYEDFTKVQLKVGTIQAAVRVPKTDKLIQLTVDLGEIGHRIIVAGIGLTYTPEGLINTQVVVVANLASRKLRGIESHGMLLAVGPSPDKLCLIRPTQSWIRDHSTSNGIAPGSDVG